MASRNTVLKCWFLQIDPKIHDIFLEKIHTICIVNETARYHSLIENMALSVSFIFRKLTIDFG